LPFVKLILVALTGLGLALTSPRPPAPDTVFRIPANIVTELGWAEFRAYHTNFEEYYCLIGTQEGDVVTVTGAMKPTQHAWFETDSLGTIVNWRVKHRNCPSNAVADFHTHPGPYEPHSPKPSPVDEASWDVYNFGFFLIGFVKPNNKCAIAVWRKTASGYELHDTRLFEQY
jgi:hypothetical protein